MDAVDLRDITTQDGPIVTREAFDITSLLIGSLDGLEYSLGLRRGGISQYASKPCTAIDLAKDMADRFSRREWALLPTEELMKSICDLFEFNHTLPTKDRIRFTARLSEIEYAYQLLPPVIDKNMTLYAKGKAYPYPYTGFPLVRTMYHPCFTYPPFRTYMAKRYLHQEPNSSQNFGSHIRLTLGISCSVIQPINISWFHGTWGEFKSRPAAEVRFDPRPTPPSNDLDVDEELLTDDDLSYLDSLYRRERRKIVRYMKAHPHKYDSPEAAGIPSESAPKSVTGSETTLENLSSSDTNPHLRHAPIPKAKKLGRAKIESSHRSPPQAVRNKSSSRLGKKRKLADDVLPASRSKRRKPA